jgi:hypothetical protein
VRQNPNGILFDPASVCKSLISYIENKQYSADDLFQLNEVWNSWQHHSKYSRTGIDAVLQAINESQREAHEFIKHADWLIITLGSSFSYRLTSVAGESRRESDKHLLMERGFGNEAFSVANCHRAPAQWFNKHMLQIDETVSMLDTCFHRLRDINPKLQIIFTISPVRHLRDGVVENNRSKGRLIEAVHHLVNKFDGLYYFPAYELVIDVLRDYRFYDIDMAHPNYAATSFVLEKFIETCIEKECQQVVKEIKKIVIAGKHRALQPDTDAHRKFLASHLEKVKSLQIAYPYLKLKKEEDFFAGGGVSE